MPPSTGSKAMPASMRPKPTHAVCVYTFFLLHVSPMNPPASTAEMMKSASTFLVKSPHSCTRTAARAKNPAVTSLLSSCTLSPLRECLRIMSPTTDPGITIRRYCSQSHVKNQLTLSHEGIIERASGAYESSALNAATSRNTSHLSLMLSLVSIQISPPQMAMLARIMMMMSHLPLSGVMPNHLAETTPATASRPTPHRLMTVPRRCTRARNMATQIPRNMRSCCHTGWTEPLIA